jgi:two-component system OmpR family sensor kinase
MSIFKKISFLFIISFILMNIIGIWIDNINGNILNNSIKEKYLQVSNEILTNFNNKNKIDEIVNKFHLIPYKKIATNENIIYTKKHTFGYISIGINNFSTEYILKIKYLDDLLVYKTNNDNLNDKNILNFLIFLDVFVLIIIFSYIMKLLLPLKSISSKIEEFSNGDLSIRIDIKSNDEIGNLSKSFNKMASNLENLIKTRESLLRDIGHELRTPIAKGKFIIEKIDDFSQKKLLKEIFIYLETLTNGLLELEKLNSNHLELKIFEVETLIVESLSKIYINDEYKININIVDNFKVEADLYYLSIALKNLIDNALKYSTQFPIVIKANNDKIYVSSSGKKLSKNLEYYLQHFTQELSQRDGFGLGLSIVNKIIIRHKFKILYQYQEGKNIFIINTKI